MICCLLAAMVLAPFGLWTIPKSAQATADCCAPSRRMSWLLGLTALGAGGLCLLAWLLYRGDPAFFHSLCRTFPGR